MRLLRSEFLRARSRRLVLMVVIGGLVAIVVSLSIAAAHSHKPGDAAVAQAQADYDRNYQRCIAGRAFGPNGEFPPQYDSLEQACRANSGPYLNINGAWLHDLPEILRGIATFVILLGAWIGASLAGADWTNNTMTTLLTWEPRRVRVLLVRGVVAVVTVAVVTLFLQAAFAGLFTLVAQLFGSTALSQSNLWSDVGATMARISAMGVAIGLVAYAIAMIGRSTVSSLGALFGYLVLVEGVIAGFRPSIEPWLLVRAAGVVISQEPLVHFGDTTMASSSPVSQATVVLSIGGAWMVVGVYAVGLLLVSLVVFRRRDVS
jgi:ABC-2 type transport system permease protein